MMPSTVIPRTADVQAARSDEVADERASISVALRFAVPRGWRQLLPECLVLRKCPQSFQPGDPPAWRRFQQVRSHTGYSASTPAAASAPCGALVEFLPHARH